MKDFFEWLLSLFARPSAGPVVTPDTPVAPVKPASNRTLAWGMKVSQKFRDLIFDIAERLDVDPDWLMACMALESAETFRADIRNAAGSGATGLIQFMPATAKGLGTSVEALARMTPEEQLDWVRMYFRPYTDRMHTLSDLYMAILWPRAIGKPEDYVLWRKGESPTTYRQNAGLDANGDHDITKAEAATKVQAKLERGRLPQFLWVES